MIGSLFQLISVDLLVSSDSYSTSTVLYNTKIMSYRQLNKKEKHERKQSKAKQKSKTETVCSRHRQATDSTATVLINTDTATAAATPTPIHCTVPYQHGVS